MSATNLLCSTLTRYGAAGAVPAIRASRYLASQVALGGVGALVSGFYASDSAIGEIVDPMTAGSVAAIFGVGALRSASNPGSGLERAICFIEGGSVCLLAGAVGAFKTAELYRQAHAKGGIALNNDFLRLAAAISGGTAAALLTGLLWSASNGV